MRKEDLIAMHSLFSSPRSGIEDLRPHGGLKAKSLFDSRCSSREELEDGNIYSLMTRP
jgi:hypothetical protein